MKKSNEKVLWTIGILSVLVAIVVILISIPNSKENNNVSKEIDKFQKNTDVIDSVTKSKKETTTKEIETSYVIEDFGEIIIEENMTIEEALTNIKNDENETSREEESVIELPFLPF